MHEYIHFAVLSIQLPAHTSTALQRPKGPSRGLRGHVIQPQEAALRAHHGQDVGLRGPCEEGGTLTAEAGHQGLADAMICEDEEANLQT